MEELVTHPMHKTHYSGIFYLDLNRFKYINDTLGHYFGDKLLVAVAERIKSFVRENDIVVRLGGDEFLIVSPYLYEDKEPSQRHCKEFAERMRKLFEPPFYIDDIRIYVQTSIGIVLIEPGEDNVDEIVRHADISMYQAKQQNHGKVAYYDDRLDVERKKRFQLQQDLMRALEQQEFELYFQPIVSAEGTLYGAEALIRWNHPEMGVLAPFSFIPLAVELGIITEIGEWVIEEACRTIIAWKEQSLWHMYYISINIDAKQLLYEGFYERFVQKLESYGIEKGELTIEVTETSLIDNFEATNEVLEKLKERGVRCAIDDFGTGYSSLSYLKKLSFSILKIDRAFMNQLLESEENIALIRTFISIARQFHYDIVLEGIEDVRQLELIKSLEKKFYYQGYLVSRPLSRDMFEKSFLQDI
jgi:diguanylate cyclase (GGDEF)-like protein